jgi:obg-like ATPase 1
MFQCYLTEAQFGRSLEAERITFLHNLLNRCGLWIQALAVEKAEVEESALMKMTVELEAGRAARVANLTKDEALTIKSFGLLTYKPMIYCANVAETDLADQGANNVHVQALRKKATEDGCEVVVISARVEAELQQMPKEEAKEWLEMLGVTDGGLANLIRATYKTLGLRTYFTTGEKETRAWTIKTGMTAPQAAGVIHTDFEQGFIRAETISYADMNKLRSEKAVKDAGLLRSEGRDYVMQEGDIVLFRFNV